MKAIFLIGGMGAGKTRLAKQLGKEKKWEVVDLDSEIEKKSKCSIPEIFKKEGESHFRDLETQALKEWKGKEVIIATGGGIIERKENREWIKKEGREIIWLDVSVKVANQRLKGKINNRPLLKGKNMEKVLEEKKRKRDPFYQSLATKKIKTDTLSFSEIIEELSPLL